MHVGVFGLAAERAEHTFKAIMKGRRAAIQNHNRQDAQKSERGQQDRALAPVHDYIVRHSNQGGDSAAQKSRTSAVQR